MDIGRLATRVAIGSFFVGHGTQKLFGWFGGTGLSGTDGMMRSLNLRPARRNSVAAGASEAAGGALLLTGLATPVAAASLIGVMTTAIRTVHLPNGPWNSNGGYEYNATLIAALLALAETGPGNLSLDHLFGTEKRGAVWGLGALAAGVAVSTVVISRGRRAPLDPDEDATPAENS